MHVGRQRAAEESNRGMRQKAWANTCSVRLGMTTTSSPFCSLAWMPSRSASFRQLPALVEAAAAALHQVSLCMK